MFRYGVVNYWFFGVEGPITYTYSVPIKVHVEVPGCATSGWPVRLTDLRLEWSGAPSVSATHDLQFKTGHHLWADFPADTLDELDLRFTQYADRLELSGTFPPGPGIPSFSESVTLGAGTPFDDGYAEAMGGSSKLGGAFVLTNAGGVTLGSGTTATTGENWILFEAPWSAPRDAWSTSADQIELGKNILLNIPTPPTLAIGAALEVLHVAGFKLNTGFALDVARRDEVYLHRVTLGEAAGSAGTPSASGEAIVRFTVPVEYHVRATSDLRYPLFANVNYVTPGGSENTIVEVPSGSVIEPSTGYWLSFMAPPMWIPYCVGQHEWVVEAAVQFDAPVHVWESGGLLAPNGDGDVLPDDADNCPLVANADQLDSDSDRMGDACDPDDDNDGVPDEGDNCDTDPNPDQTDADGDSVGDACDSDLDADGIANSTDNCPLVGNVGQENSDSDFDGDACDWDDDADGVADAADNCPLLANSRQADLDGDGRGDVCDEDLDGDGTPTSGDNCPALPNTNQHDFDGDGSGDACDVDVDGDGVSNEPDACQFTQLGSVVKASGCSLAQLCPCDAPRGRTTPWGNHGKYVSCTAHAAEAFLGEGLITAAEKDVIVSASAQSSCGVKN